MKMVNGTVAKILSAVVLFGPLTVMAQATTSVFLNLSQMQFEKNLQSDMARVNLVNEAKRANPALKSLPYLEVQMLRLEAKSGLGGSQVFLRVNNEMMDSQVVDTDPDLLTSLDAQTFQKVDLKNIDRSQVLEASLIIQGFANFRLRSMELILGQVQEPVVFGRYADEQALLVGGDAGVASGEVDQVVRPTAEAISDIYIRYYQGNQALLDKQNGIVQPSQPVMTVTQSQAVNPVQPAVVPQQAPPATRVTQVANQASAPAVNTCVRHANGYAVCVGDIVQNIWRFSGKVISVNASQRKITVKLEYTDSIREGDVDSFQKR